MKCAACGFEEKSHVVKYDEAVLFKSGRRKGELREIRHVEYDVFENEPKFKQVFVGKQIEALCWNSDSTIRGERQLFVAHNDGYNTNYEAVALYVCPECGTVRAESNY